MLRREVLRSMIGVAELDSSANAGSDLIRRLAEECIRGDDPAAAVRLFAPDYRCRGSFGEWDVREWKRMVALLRENISGLGVTIHELLRARDRVTVRWSLHGTERASRQAFRLDGISIERVSSGRILESYVAADVLPCLRALGWVATREAI